MNQTKLTVVENGRPLDYSYTDLMHCHGFGFPVA